jgi:hypothetical protein
MENDWLTPSKLTKEYLHVQKALILKPLKAE